MQQMILAPGPPPLTVQAADAALEAIDFIAAAVRGYDAIDVTEVVRPLWRKHLPAWYQELPFPTRAWYANAPFTLATLHAQWPLLHPVQRGMTLQQWSIELPYMLMMLDPVLEAAQAIETREQLRESIAAARQQARQVRAEPEDSNAQAIDAINRNQEQAAMLQRHNTRMTDLTIGLMRAMNRR